jgi:hypothetical protein
MKRILHNHEWIHFTNSISLGRPLFCEERFERAVEAQAHEIALTRHALHPVTVLNSLGKFRPYIDGRGTVGVSKRLPAARVLQLTMGGGSSLVALQAEPPGS